ncbi:MAG: DHH family phosphoesterase [Clostridia bacterium]|nr:DHH family phosphoesterase [Clostridia bacterium]
MKNKKKYDLRILWIVAVILVTLAVSYRIGTEFLIGEVVMLGVIVLVLLIMDMRRHIGLYAYFDKGTRAISAIVHNAVMDLGIPTFIVGENNVIIWNNDSASSAMKNKELCGCDLTSIAPEANLRDYSVDQLKEGVRINAYNGRVYRMYGKLEKQNRKPVTVVYLQDITDAQEALNNFEKTRPVVAIVVLDNLSIVSRNVRAGDVSRASAVAQAEDILSEWMNSCGGLLKKFDDSKYLCIFEKQYLAAFKAENFPVSNRISEIKINNFALTVSIGVGVDGKDFETAYKYAEQALDTALARGGAQTAIKNNARRDKDSFEHIGGRFQTIEKSSRVKSSYVASMLVSHMNKADNIIVMGHAAADFDAIGAAVGVARIAKNCKKPVNIVCNRGTCLAMSVVDKLSTLPDYRDVFVDGAVALDLLKRNTLLVIVDTHLARQLEEPMIFRNAGAVAVIDHHRKMPDAIDSADIMEIESYASSASELVTEFIQFMDMEDPLLKEEADALLAGIVLDTHGFDFKSGVRTFESAAFLRSMGADTTEVRKLFRSKERDFKLLTEGIRIASVYRKKTIISAIDVEDDSVYTRDIVGKLADELLSVEGIEASFVLVRRPTGIQISSRSMGLINVQNIVEKLSASSGGHFTSAGGMFDGDIEEAVSLLKKQIDRYAQNENIQMED